LYPDAVARKQVTQAAATGHELLIVGFGAAGHCGLCNAQMLNASWVSWFKSEVDFAASKGVGMSAYTLMQHNGWGEVVPTAEQALQKVSGSSSSSSPERTLLMSSRHAYL
jgi:sugar phosphate isomerase/epimerase